MLYHANEVKTEAWCLLTVQTTSYDVSGWFAFGICSGTPGWFEFGISDIPRWCAFGIVPAFPGGASVAYPKEWFRPSR